MLAESIILFFGICLAVVFVAVLVMKFILGVYMPFKDDRDYIRMEIVRSHGYERVHWEHELTRFYLGYIPVVGKSLSKRYKRRKKKLPEKKGLYK